MPTPLRKRRLKVKIGSNHGQTPSKRSATLFDRLEKAENNQATQVGSTPTSSENQLAVLKALQHTEELPQSINKRKSKVNAPRVKPEKKPKAPKKNGRKFNFDIILSGIAIGCILGSVLFYFQGLQPLILSNIIDLNSDQAKELGSDFIDSANSIQQISFSLDQSFAEAENQVCSQELIYKTSAEDLNTVSQIDRNLIPNLTLRDAAVFNNFSDSDITAKYIELYDTYSTILISQRDFETQFRDAITFLEYRNIWINTCQRALDRTAPAAEQQEYIEEFCRDTQDIEARINTSSIIWENARPVILSATSLCSVEQVVPSEWNETLLASYGEISAITSEHITNIEVLDRDRRQLDQAIQTFNQNIQTLEDEKTTFTGMWYVLPFGNV